ncbi:MAG: hypothetical protein HYT48_01705 [Candidatus Vogelbacteria bacterium]|nr:hypothetical protein [Candidatus Vogelbacteria bacterium]
MQNIQEKLKNFKVLFLDADGVFFDGQETRSTLADGAVIISKSRGHQDGQGISFLREIGIKIVFVSGEGEPLGGIVDRFNTLTSAKSGRWPKVELFTKQGGKGAKLETIRSWLAENKLTFVDTIYMGDDINDRDAMLAIQNEGIIVCPANATRTVRPLAHIITKRPGGFGAIREFAEMVLDARGINENDFPPA